MDDSALGIHTAWELERFDLGTVLINRRQYTVLTGHEGTGMCFWCGSELKGKLKRYCRGHMIEYYNHFEWQSARNWCCKRQDGLCANCYKSYGYSLEVHHIIPLNGEARYFTAFNLPWNLIGLCHMCHQEVHAAMRPLRLSGKSSALDTWEEARTIGQGIFESYVKEPWYLA